MTKEIIAFAIVALLTASTGALAFTGAAAATAENTSISRLG